MTQLTHAEYEALERSVIDRRRIAVYRRGTEYVVVPHALRLQSGRELLESVHPTTGESLVFYIDEIDGIEVIG